MQSAHCKQHIAAWGMSVAHGRRLLHTGNAGEAAQTASTAALAHGAQLFGCKNSMSSMCMQNDKAAKQWNLEELHVQAVRRGQQNCKTTAGTDKMTSLLANITDILHAQAV
jgi:hypothetical protein